MDEQGLFDWDPAREPADETPGDGLSLDEKFEQFLVDCPDVYPLFVKLARQLREAGHARYGSKGIVEVIRFNRATSGRDRDGWKINNLFTSRLSRKMIEDFPEYADFFEFRALRSRERQ